jgi:hypothetical protein
MFDLSFVRAGCNRSISICERDTFTIIRLIDNAAVDDKACARTERPIAVIMGYDDDSGAQLV